MKKVVLSFSLLLLFANLSAAQNQKHIFKKKPTGKGYPEATLNSTVVATGNGIQYHGGPVLQGTLNVYYIWYGDWSGSARTQSLLEYAADHIGGSPYFRINTTYRDGRGYRVSGLVNFAGATNDFYSLGKSLTDEKVQSIVASAIKGGRLPKDSHAVYFVLSSKDVSESSGFCRRYCGWHSHGWVSGYNIKYAFVGNPLRCPSACESQTQGPNGSASGDAMASIIVHELEEAATDPDLDAWYDGEGEENADKCAWTFGSSYTAANGSQANMKLGEKNFYIQQNWVNAKGGFCATKY